MYTWKLNLYILRDTFVESKRYKASTGHAWSSGDDSLMAGSLAANVSAAMWPSSVKDSY